MRSLLFAILAVAAANPAAAAVTVFTETFDTVRPQTYATGTNVGQFKITAGDADVAGDLNGFFYGCGGNNNCVDMNGNYAATFTANVDLIAGNNYRISFDIAGNGPRASDLYSLAAGLGSSPYYRFDTAPGTPFHTVSFDYLATATGTAQLQLQSLNTDGPNYWGMLLDNVKVDNLTATSAVPEPATWAMLMLGFGGMGHILRRRSQVGARLRFS